MPDTIQELERERQGIFRQIDELGDFRAGSITGKSAGCPAFLPCLSRLNGMGGELHSDHGPKFR